MSEDFLDEDTWKPLKRGGNRPVSARPLVAVRKQGFAFNKAFIDSAKLSEFNYVTAKYNDAQRRVAFLFHNDADDENCYPLL